MRRVEQHDGEDGDRLVGQRGVALEQPQRGGDRRRDEQQDDERIGELGEELRPGGGHQPLGGSCSAVALELRPRLALAQSEPWGAFLSCADALLSALTR